MAAIAEALGCHQSSVANDLHELGIATPWRSKDRRRPGVPEPVDWRTDPPKEPPQYKTARVVVDLERWIEGYEQDRHLNRLAWNVHEALGAGDGEWVARVRQLLVEAQLQMGQLYQVVTDQMYRAEVAKGDPVPLPEQPNLRVVKGGK